jgi:hypothetical protein
VSEAASVAEAASMLIRYFGEIATPFEVVENAMLAAPETWMPGLVRDTEREREALLLEVGVGDESGHSRRPSEIRFGEALRLPAKTILPMRWRPSSAWPLFPEFEADLEVASLGPSRTQLSVNARYTPPLGRLGSVIDRALLHRVAEATVKDFVDRVSAELQRDTDAVPAAASGSPAG